MSANLLGRVNSVYRMLGWGLMPLGALAGGFVAHAAGLRATYLAAGGLCAVALLAAAPLVLAAADKDQKLFLSERTADFPPDICA